MNASSLELLYGTGIRLSECTRLKIQDLDLLHGSLWVLDGEDQTRPVRMKLVCILARA